MSEEAFTCIACFISSNIWHMQKKKSCNSLLTEMLLKEAKKERFPSCFHHAKCYLINSTWYSALDSKVGKIHPLFTPAGWTWAINGQVELFKWSLEKAFCKGGGFSYEIRSCYPDQWAVYLKGQEHHRDLSSHAQSSLSRDFSIFVNCLLNKGDFNAVY